VLTPAIDVPKEVEAFKTLVFVVVMLVLAVPTFVLIVASVAPSELLALVTSDCTASEPLERPAPVRVRVALPQTSEARVPKLVSVLPAKFQITVGSDAILVPRLEEALSTFVLVVEMLVLAVASVAPSELEARLVLLLTEAVPAVMLADKLVEAAKTVAFVLLLIEVTAPET
jgi:hypothetical protein